MAPVQGSEAQAEQGSHAMGSVLHGVRKSLSRITPAVLLFLLTLTLTQLTLIPLISDVINFSRYKSEPSPSSKVRSNGTANVGTRAKLDWELPRTVKSVFSMTRQSKDADFHRDHDWSQPMVLTSYGRPLPGNPRHTELFIYTTGISMGSFERNLDVHGCMVGKDVYPAIDFQWDILRCDVARRIHPGEALTVVLVRDIVLMEAMDGPVIIGRNFKAELAEGDINDLPSDAVLHGFPSLDISEFATVRSSEQWSTQMDEEKVSDMPSLPRYEICAMTLMKPYPHLLQDWIDYNRRIGVDMIYLFDNHADDDLAKVYGHRRDMEVVYWPWGRTQVQGNTYFLTMARARCEWVLFTDSDEYIMIGVGEGNDSIDKRVLKEFVVSKRLAGYNEIKFFYLLFGSSGHVTLPIGPIPESYTHLHNSQNRNNGKVMCQTDLDWARLAIHWGQGREPVKTFEDNANMTYPKVLSDTPSLIHYQFRSFEDLIIKKQFGSPSTVDALPAGKGNLDVTKPPRSYTEYSGHPEHTHFRDIWRRISGRVPLDMQVIVQVRDGKRCTVKYKIGQGRKSFYDESCA